MNEFKEGKYALCIKSEFSLSERKAYKKGKRYLITHVFKSDNTLGIKEYQCIVDGNNFIPFNSDKLIKYY